MPAIQATDLDPARRSPEALLTAAAENRGRLRLVAAACARGWQAYAPNFGHAKTMTRIADATRA